MQKFLFFNKHSISHNDDFAHFYEAAQLDVYRYSLVLCAGNTSEAEDLTAETFLRAWDKRGQFTGSREEAIRWAIRIARNIAIDRYRQTGGVGLEPLDETFPAPAVAIETILLEKEEFQRALDAINTLPLRQRDIFSLRYILGWQVKEIAAQLQLPENNISVDLRRALHKLQEQLMPQGINHEK